MSRRKKNEVVVDDDFEEDDSSERLQKSFMPLLTMRCPSVVPTLPRLGRHRVHRAAAIPEVFGMTTTIQKTSGKITGIGMTMRTKRGMSGRMVDIIL